MSEEYVLQITYQGIDDKGRTVMLNVRGNSTKQFDEMLTHASPLINTLRPLPVKQYGSGSGQSARKPIVYLPDAPKCPKHGTSLNIREWKPQDSDKVLHFWSCGEKTDGQFCREKVKPDPTPEQVAKWRELNGIEAPKPATQKDQQTTGAGSTNWQSAFEGLQLPDFKAKAFLNTTKGDYEAAYKLAKQAQA